MFVLEVKLAAKKNKAQNIKEQKWYSELTANGKFVFDLIGKYHNYFSSQDRKFKRRVHWLKILILFLSMVSTIVLGLKSIINIDFQVSIGLIVSALITFITAISSYFNFEEYWMRNISIHIKLNVLRDCFIFDALSEVINEERLRYYEDQLTNIQNENISYWEKAIKRI